MEQFQLISFEPILLGLGPEVYKPIFFFKTNRFFLTELVSLLWWENQFPGFKSISVYKPVLDKKLI
ncbi:hypothetical protein Hdeb2414_s0017g00510491 [Helianthus debilis subsp. tardiflorus]